VGEGGWAGVGMYEANFHSTVSFTLCLVNRTGVERRVTNWYLMRLGNELQSDLWLAHKITVKRPSKRNVPTSFSAISVHFHSKTN